MAVTGVARLTTRAVRFIRLILHITSGLLQSFVLPYISATRQNRMASNWARKFLRILNIKLSLSGTLPVCDRQGAILVANHISWLDIVAILAVYPVRFVAKAEISTWPVLGRLCRNAGTLFIEREKRNDTLRINQQIAGVLKSGHSVVIFPEGTTGDGDVLRHFHASLLQPAVTTRTLLYPVAIRYSSCDGSRNSSVAYVSVTMLQSLIQILAEPEIRVELIFKEPVSGADRNRRELARLAEKAIARTLSLNIRHMAPEIPSDLPVERM
ncbi:lysophospholipid acyltransferase family protein [Nitrosomonas sp.]|uniref:lysophospholipid acyltransferase family protein n=1 Tax=Nitrosomonas sp. TaxID=42353 RepID=UPI0025DCDE60|nr:lysophospholipid acyltransferase family protein [Nitrosomonas sp.]MCC6916840.1 1-acyl-sn-glycerol-3-phosphate acyltransferase [Nitrosomonas sp.]